MDELIWLMDWYNSQCNNSWERQFGVQLTTTDNPGWHLTVNLEQTHLEALDFERVEHLGDDSWWQCWTQDKQFLASCGPRDLPAVLAVFRKWAETTA